MAIPAAEWLDLIERDYLADFVPSGGAAVKFVVVDEPDSARLLSLRFDALAERHGLARAAVDGAISRLHMIQDVFFAVARQIDWAMMAQLFIERLFQANAYAWPRPGEPMAMQDLADANAVDLAILQRELRRWLTIAIMHDPAMAQDFRIAMTRLCLDRASAAAEAESVVDPILEWLRGELRVIGPLRSADIFTKITRHNARAMLRSLLRWLRLLDLRGLLLTLDIRPLTPSPMLLAEGLRYTPAAVLDGYEVLRQLIDDADGFEGLFLAVIANREFLNGDPKRSIDRYTALKMRIWDDVRARDRDNPVAPLVVLAETGWTTP